MMVRSIERGLPLSEWQHMTFGMIVDYIIEYNNLNAEETVRDANQTDIDKF